MYTTASPSGPSARRCWRTRLSAAAVAGLIATGAAAAAEEPPIELDVIGGLAVVSQYERLEKPFWTERLPEITDGRVRARIQPFDRSGIAGPEVLRLLRLGVLSYGNILLGLAAADEPELNAVDLPLLSPDMAALRRTVDAWRPWMEEVLRDRFGLEPLAVYTYPPQVMFCREPFQGLKVAGRRVRTSSVGQSELVKAAGGIPVVIPFAEIIPAMRDGVVACAITSAPAGQAIGLPARAPHVGRLGLSWGLSVFAANQVSWQALPEDLRTQIRHGIHDLERAIWEEVSRDSETARDCEAAPTACGGARPDLTADRDEADRLRLLTETIIPRWVDRCGPRCAEAWNRHMAAAVGVTAEVR